MKSGVHFGQLSLIISIVAVFAQFYLFLRLRRAIRASRLSDLPKALLTGAVGLTIALLFAMNAFTLSKPIPWVDPPEAAFLEGRSPAARPARFLEESPADPRAACHVEEPVDFQAECREGRPVESRAGLEAYPVARPDYDEQLGSDGGMLIATGFKRTSRSSV